MCVSGVWGGEERGGAEVRCGGGGWVGFPVLWFAVMEVEGPQALREAEEGCEFGCAVGKVNLGGCLVALLGS